MEPIFQMKTKYDKVMELFAEFVFYEDDEDATIATLHTGAGYVEYSSGDIYCHFNSLDDLYDQLNKYRKAYEHVDVAIEELKTKFNSYELRIIMKKLGEDD